ARRAADRRLVDLDRPGEVLHALEAPVRADPPDREPEGAAHGPVENVVDERRFARAGDPGDARPGTEREAHVDAAEVVLGGPAHDEPRGALEGAARTEPGAGTVQIAAGERRRDRRELGRRGDRHEPSPVHAGPGAEV